MIGLGTHAVSRVNGRESRPLDALVQELDEAGSDAFAALEGDDLRPTRSSPTPSEDHQEELDELRQVAPADIAGDVDVLSAAQEQRATGGEQEDVTAEAAAAEERVLAFEEEHCAATD